MPKMSRRDWQNADPLVVDQKWIFVGAVRGPAIFHHAKKAGRALVLYAIIQNDAAAGDILFQPMSRKLTVTTFARDDGGDAFFLEPCEQSAQLAAQDPQI